VTLTWGTLAAGRRRAAPPPPARASAASRGYGRRWRRLASLVLAGSPWCSDCLTEPSSEVHHLVAKRDGGEDDAANLLALCKSCHSKRTADEARGRAP